MTPATDGPHQPATPVRVVGRPARLLLVHAHPDDESLATGVTIAHHVAAGDEVHVLTCTLGEQGEIIPPELAHLAAEADDALGPHRREELRAATAAIGAVSHLLGEDPAAGQLSRWRDSGMAGTPSAEDPRAWVQADLDEAAAAVREVVVEVAPDLVVTYDAHGGYAHPDHIRTHEVTCAALAGLPETERPALFGIFTSESWAAEDRRWLLANAPADRGWAQPDGPFPPSVVPDEVVTHEVADAAAVAGQLAALREHRTQVTLDPPCYALSNDIAARLPGREGFARLDVATGAPVPATVEGLRPGLVERATHAGEVVR